MMISPLSVYNYSNRASVNQKINFGNRFWCIQTNDYQKYLLKNIQVPPELKTEMLVVIGAATEIIPDETVL